MSERLRIVLELDDKGFVKRVNQSTSKLRKLGTETQRVERGMERAEKRTVSWGRKLRDVTVTLASLNYLLPNLVNVLTGWQQGIITANAELEQSIAVMKNFSREQTDLAREMEARNFVDVITQRAQSAPFAIEALTDSMVKLRVAGIDDVEQGFIALTDSVASFSGTDQQLKRASVAIQQMAGKGNISMEELRQQLGEAVPSAIRIMAQSLGTTYQKLVKEISTGNVRSKPALIEMFKEMEKQLGGSAERMMGTWNGLVAQLKTQVTVMQRKLGQAGYISALKTQLTDLINILKTNEFKQFAISVGEGLGEVVRVARELVETIYENRDAIKALIIGYLSFKAASIAISGAQAAMTALNGVSLRSVTLMGRLTRQMITGRKAQESFSQVTQRHLGVIRANNAELLKTQAYTTSWHEADKKMAGSLAKSEIAMRRKTAAARLLRVAMLGVRSVMGGIVGLGIPLAIGAFASFASSINEVSKAAKENVDRLIELQGTMATVGQLKDARDEKKALEEERNTLGDIATLKERVAKAEESYQYARTNNLGAELENQMYNQYRKLLDDLNRLENEIPARLREINGVLANAEASVIKGLTGTLVDRARQNYSNLISDAQTSYTSAMKAISAEMEGDDPITGKEATSRRLAATKELAAKQAATWQRILNNRLSNAKVLEMSDEELTAFNNSLDFMQKEIDKYKSAITEDDLGKLEDALGIDGSSKKALQEAQFALYGVTNKIGELQGKIARIKNEDSESGGLYEQFIAKLGDKAEVEEIAKLLPQIKALFTELNELEIEQGQTKQLDKLQGKYERVIFGIQTKLEDHTQNMSRLAVDGVALITKNVLTYTKSAETMRKELELLDGKQLSSANLAKKLRLEQQLKEGEAVAQQLDYAQTYDLIQGKIQQLRESYQSEAVSREQYFNSAIANANSLLTSLDTEAEGYQKVAQSLRNYIAELQKARAIQSDSSILQRHIKDWGNVEMAVGNLQTQALDGVVDMLTNGLTGAEIGFKDFAKSFIQMITKMTIKMIAFKAITGAMGMFNSGGGSNPIADNGLSGQMFQQGVAFAKGGIMTNEGSRALPKRAYSRGGIANEPQLAMFGEGSVPEAYVPLPDGRTIPVTMKGGTSDVQVNVINKTSSQAEATANSRFDGEKMVVDIMLKNINQPGPVRESIKGL